MLEVSRDAGTCIYIYCKRLDSSTSQLLCWEQFLKLKQSYDIPLSENILHGDLLGMYAAAYYETESMDSLGQEFLDLLDQASWYHAGMTGSLWLHRCGMGCCRD